MNKTIIFKDVLLDRQIEEIIRVVTQLQSSITTVSTAAPAQITVGLNPPSNPSVNALWVDTN